MKINDEWTYWKLCVLRLSEDRYATFLHTINYFIDKNRGNYSATYKYLRIVNVYETLTNKNEEIRHFNVHIFKSKRLNKNC